MPELPEVETVVRELERHKLIGRKLSGATVHWERSVDRPSVDEFCKRLCGQMVTAIGRRAKYIHLTLSKDHLFIHLRMTGKLLFRRGPAAPYERLALNFTSGPRLAFDDTRKFGRFYLVTDPQELIGHLGVEPLSDAFTAQQLAAIIEGRRTAAKPFLLQQQHVCGLGNIYVDEALWLARIHPLTPIGSLSEAQITSLHRAIRKVLRRGIATNGTSLGTGAGNYYSVSGRRGRHQDQLAVFRRQGEPCPRCSTTILRLLVGQRSTHICPKCQQP